MAGKAGWLRGIAWWLILASTLVAPATRPVPGQEVSAALKDRVSQLLERLRGDKADERDTAEKALVDLGSRALPLLPEAASGKTGDFEQRLERIRQTLATPEGGDELEPRRVTIHGTGIRLSEVLRELQSQTGNRITDLREAFGQDATNPGLDLDLEKVPFLEALDHVAKQAGLTPTFFTGDGTIGLTAGPTDEAGGTGTTSAVPMRVYTGPFRVEFKQYAVQSDLASGVKSANAQFEIDWEPRLRPMLMKLEASNVEILDDLFRAVEPSVSEESGTVVLRPENPAAELNLNMTPPGRDAKMLGTLKVKAELTVPAANQVFRFPSLAASDVTQEVGPIKMKFISAEVDEFVWKVNVEVTYDGEGGGEAFETYRQGLFNNRLWLQRADGSRFEHNGGFNQTGESGTSLRFQYLFVDAPGKPADYQLVYETPSKVKTIPLEFTFTDVPLP